MKWDMSNWRVWLFRGLVAVAAGLMIASFIMPWWTAKIDLVPDIKYPIRIYGYGLRHSLVELRSYIAEDETPFYQTVLAWVYLASSVGLALYSTWLRGKKGRWLLGGIGLIYIAYAAIAAYVVISNRTADFEIPLQGWITMGPEGGGVSIFASLRFGYYLAYAAGGMCVALSLLSVIGYKKRGLGELSPNPLKVVTR